MDWKIIAALVVAVAIVVSGFLASGGINLTGDNFQLPVQNPQTSSNPIGDFLAGAKDAISNVLSGTGITTEKNINRTLQVSGTLAMEGNVLRFNSPASMIDLELSSANSINIGSERIDFPEGAKVSFGNFSGKLDIYPNYTVAADGTAETISASNIGIVPHSPKKVPVRLAASVKSAKLYNASISFNMNATGSLDVGQGRIALKVYSEPILIENFKGDVNIAGSNMVIDGYSTKVLISGSERISIG